MYSTNLYLSVTFIKKIIMSSHFFKLKLFQEYAQNAEIYNVYIYKNSKKVVIKMMNKIAQTHT